MLDVLLPYRRAKRGLDEQNDRLESFLRSIPIEYCGWDQASLQVVSPGFAALLGLSRVETLRQIEEAVSPNDATVLRGLWDRLQKYDESFEVGVRALSTGRSLKFFGKKGVLADKSQVFSVIWVMDVTDFVAAATRSVDALTQSERREGELRAALNALPFPVWLRNDNLDLTWCNKSYARVVDDSSATVVAEQKELPSAGANKGDIGQRVLAQRAMAKAGPQSARGHMIVEGQRRLVEITETPLSAEKRMVGVALDVTREEELGTEIQRHIVAHYEALEHLNAAVAKYDRDMRLEFYNSAYEQMTSLSSTWLDTKPKITEIIDKLRELRKIPDQADYKQFKQAWINRFTSLIDPYEEMQYMPDGAVLRMVVVPRPTGGLVQTFEDVTSRLQLETSYNTLMAVQQETLDNLAEGIVVFGEDGKLRISNHAFAKMWDIPPEAITGAPHVSKIIDRAKPFFSDRDWPAVRDILLGNALERESRKGRLYLTKGNRRGTVVEYAVVPLPDGNILNAYFDITDTVKVEEALVEKNAALEEAERLKTDFLANVSYQLRTPLNAMMGFAEMLNQQYFGKLNERQLEYTHNMIEAGQRLVSLVNDILDLANIDAGYMKLYPTDVNIGSVVEQVVSLTEGWAHKQKLEMSVTAPGVPVTVYADERRVKQVFLNLISNAINYSPNGGRIALSVQVLEGFAVVRVRDNGIGIPASEIERVFTPFEKIRQQKSKRRGGAGLGLALVKSIVQMHGGDVSIKSKEGEGTEVTFRLPLVPMA